MEEKSSFENEINISTERCSKSRDNETRTEVANSVDTVVNKDLSLRDEECEYVSVQTGKKENEPTKQNSVSEDFVKDDSQLRQERMSENQRETNISSEIVKGTTCELLNEDDNTIDEILPPKVVVVNTIKVDDGVMGSSQCVEAELYDTDLMRLIVNSEKPDNITNETLNKFIGKTQNREKTRTDYICKLCNKLFQQKRSVYHHVQKHLTGESFGPITYLCDMCGKSCYTKKAITKHVAEHNISATMCEKCKKILATYSAYVQHKKIHEDTKGNSCTQCERTFSCEKHLKQHMVVHKTRERGSPFLCSMCQRSFLHKSSLKRHIVIHGEEDVYRCSFCKKSYFSKISLSKHELIHSGKYTCELCGKMFSFKAHLDRHTRTHTRETPFQCEFCSKRFSDKSQMVRHIKIHTVTEAPFSCVVCRKSFTQRGYLVQHTRIHVTNAPFQCEFCEKSYCEQYKLVNHRRTHTQETVYCCEFCGESFTQKCNLRRHLRNHNCSDIRREKI